MNPKTKPRPKDTTSTARKNPLIAIQTRVFGSHAPAKEELTTEEIADIMTFYERCR